MDHDILDAFASWIVCEFRANGGRLEAPFDYANLILLTTRTVGGGRMRPVPVICCPDPNGIMVAAVDRPGQGYPIWYLNLVTDPWAMVETGQSTFQASAEIITSPARAEVLHRLARLGPERAACLGGGTHTTSLVRLVPAAPA